jgi:protein TonB
VVVARRIGFVRVISRLAAAFIVAAAALGALFATTQVNWPRSESPTVVAVSAEPSPKETQQTRPRAQPNPPSAVLPDTDAAPEIMATPPPVVEVTSPIWLARPRHPERRYPPAAFAAGIAGEVLLDCAVAVDGKLDCTIVSESPPDWGFGDAALALAGEHIMAPPTQNGAPARGHYRMRIPFRTR